MNKKLQEGEGNACDQLEGALAEDEDAFHSYSASSRLNRTLQMLEWSRSDHHLLENEQMILAQGEQNDWKSNLLKQITHAHERNGIVPCYCELVDPASSVSSGESQFIDCFWLLFGLRFINCQ